MKVEIHDLQAKIKELEKANRKLKKDLKYVVEIASTFCNFSKVSVPYRNALSAWVTWIKDYKVVYKFERFYNKGKG